MGELKRDLQALVVTTLELEDMKPEEISTSEPLFQDGLGLDSIDALELGIAIQKKYGLKLDAEDDATREHFYSIDSLAKFVAASSLEGDRP